LLPVAIEGPAPEPGTPIMVGEREAGEMRSSAEGMGLALLRVDALAGLKGADGGLTADGAALTPLRPPWLAAPGGDPDQNDGATQDEAPDTPKTSGG
jgi:hypothetical protein